MIDFFEELGLNLKGYSEEEKIETEKLLEELATLTLPKINKRCIQDNFYCQSFPPQLTGNEEKRAIRMIRAEIKRIKESRS